MPKQVVDRWIDYYETQARFSIGSAEIDESHSELAQNYWFWMNIDLKMRTQLFEIQNWLVPHVIDYEPRCTIKDHSRSYMNLCTQGDPVKGHVDVAACPPGGFYVVALVFMNPYVTDPADSGFHIGDQYYENHFNRMIIFDGRAWHKSQIPTDNLVRLTMYNSFCQPRRVMNYTQVRSQWRK